MAISLARTEACPQAYAPVWEAILDIFWPWQRSCCHFLMICWSASTYRHVPGTSHSGFLRELAERELAVNASQERSGIQALLGDPVRLGGDATKLIRHDRRSR